MCSQRKTACDAGLKLGAAQEVHSFAASVLGDPPILVCSGAFVIVPHGEYEVVCIFVQLSFPRELGRYDFFFFQCVKSHEFHCESYDVWMGFKDVENFLGWFFSSFSVSGIESFIKIISFCCCFQCLPPRKVTGLVLRVTSLEVMSCFLLPNTSLLHDWQQASDSPAVPSERRRQTNRDGRGQDHGVTLGLNHLQTGCQNNVD